MLDWLVARLPVASQRLYECDLLRHIVIGNLGVVQWLHEHKRKISQKAINTTVTKERLNILQFFYEHSNKCYQMDALNRAAELGFADTVRFVVTYEEKEKKEISKDVID